MNCWQSSQPKYSHNPLSVYNSLSSAILYMIWGILRYRLTYLYVSSNLDINVVRYILHHTAKYVVDTLRFFLQKRTYDAPPYLIDQSKQPSWTSSDLRFFTYLV